MFKSIVAQNSACNAIVRLVDVGTDHSSAGIYLYDTTAIWPSIFSIPMYNPDSTTPTPLTRLAMSNPAFMDATDGTAFASHINDATAFRDGTASMFGVYNRDSTFIFGGTVSMGVADMILAQTVIEQDQTVVLTSAYYLVP